MRNTLLGTIFLLAVSGAVILVVGGLAAFTVGLLVGWLS